MTALTLDLVKGYLRYELDAIDNDLMLSVALQAGIEWVELYTGRAITGEDPETIPAGMLHGVLLYAGAFDQLRDGDNVALLKPAELVCWPHKVLAV